MAATWVCCALRKVCRSSRRSGREIARICTARIPALRAPPTATAVQQAGGQAQAAPPPPPRRRGPQLTEIALQQTSGVHDLYLVFKNDAARDIDPLMTLSGITLVAE